MTRPIVIDGQPPKERNTAMIFLPIGMYCNKQIQKAENDSVVEFRDGWQRTKVVLVRKCKVNVNSSVFTFLLQSIYGANMRWEDLRKRWEAWAVVEGIGKDGFSDTEVLLLELKDYDEAEYNAEQERKLLEAEARQKAAEKERLLKQAREKKIYEHKDIIS